MAEAPGPAEMAQSVPEAGAAAPKESLGREQVLDLVVDQFLQTLDVGGCPLFSKCYSRLYKAHPEFTKCVYNQFISHLQNSVREEIRALKQEGNLQMLLESLDWLEKGAKGQEAPAWRPSGIPEEDARAAVVPYLLKQRKLLRKALEEKVESNSRLAEAVLAGRRRTVALQEEIRERKGEWEGIAAEGRKITDAFELPS